MALLSDPRKAEQVPVTPDELDEAMGPAANPSPDQVEPFGTPVVDDIDARGACRELFS